MFRHPGRTCLAQINCHRDRICRYPLARCRLRLNAPVGQTGNGDAAKQDCGDRPSPIRLLCSLRPAFACNDRIFLFLEFPQLKKFARTLRTFQHMKIFGIRQIKSFGVKHPRLKGGVIEAADTVWIRVVFEDMLLKLLEKKGVVLIILRMRPPLFHESLPTKSPSRSFFESPRIPNLVRRRSR